MSQPLPPFSCIYSPNFPELLSDLHCSLAISTYQAGKVVFISAQDRSKLIQLPRNFEKPMGIAIDGDRMAVATRDRVVTFRNGSDMARNFPKSPATYDALFLPRSSYHTGELDIHDLFFLDGKLLAVNTQFSCLAQIDDAYSFTPVWQPSFLKSLAPNDQCHLNGIAFRNNIPAYATALGESSEPKGWRPNKLNGGVLIDMIINQIITRNLPMPHSPRLYNDKLFVLLSGTGELAQVDMQTGELTVLKELNGFVRGMDKVGDYLFIGLSKLRETSSSFADLPIAKKSIYAGVAVIHEPTMAVVAQLRYETSVEEIYDVKILPGILRPNILTAEKEDHRMAITTPKESFWAFTEQP
jgi:uncharacterized protein (TIGR03032 family)